MPWHSGKSLFIIQIIIILKAIAAPSIKIILSKRKFVKKQAKEGINGRRSQPICEWPSIGTGEAPERVNQVHLHLSIFANGCIAPVLIHNNRLSVSNYYKNGINVKVACVHAKKSIF